MLTLITGLPGNGKTLYALQYVSQWVKRDISNEHPAPRPVYYHGINGLSPELGWHRLDTKAEPVNGEKNLPVDVPQWWLCPPRSIIIIDEAQMCGFGLRARGQVPEWGQLLETHRHRGLDIVLITQSPTLIDPHDRALCELHFHVMRTFGMQRAVIHEFRPVRTNVLATRKGSIEHRWTYPKEVFQSYVSAEAHTHKRRLPMRVVIFIALPFIIAALGWFAWAKYLSPNRDAIKLKQAEAAASAVPPRAGSPSTPTGKLSTPDYVSQFVPRIKGLAYTAPVYDDVTKPVEAPYPAACVAAAKRCQCYTQQGTRIATTPELCADIVAGGFFVAWKQPEPPPAKQAPERPQTPQEDVGAPPVMIGHTRMAPKPSPSILDNDPTTPGNGRGKNLPPATPPSNGPT